MTQELQFDFVQHMWLREKVLAQVGPQLAADLYPVASWRDHPPIATARVNQSTPDAAKLREAGGRRNRREHRAMLESLLPNWIRLKASSSPISYCCPDPTIGSSPESIRLVESRCSRMICIFRTTYLASGTRAI
jgi:hypothetical protein